MYICSEMQISITCVNLLGLIFVCKFLNWIKTENPADSDRINAVIGGVLIEFKPSTKGIDLHANYIRGMCIPVGDACHYILFNSMTPNTTVPHITPVFYL